MARFFFQIVDGGEQIPDDDGVPFDGLPEARSHGLRAIAEMVTEALRCAAVRWITASISTLSMLVASSGHSWTRVASSV